MRTSSTKRAGQLDIRTPNIQARRSFARVSRRRAWAGACYIGTLWDVIVLLMFAWCLFGFLDAFLGFGYADEDWRTSNDTLVHSRTPLSISPPWNRGSVASNEEQKIRTHGLSRVMVDWHGSYELLTSTTALAPESVSPALIPQDAFPDPTPALDRAKRLGEGSFFRPTKAETPARIPFTFYGVPYDPFRLEFGDAVEGDENHGLHPVAAPPRTP